VDETVRRAAYTVEAIVGEVIVICGPLLLSGFLWLSGATAAVMAGAALAASGAVGLALTSASRSHRSGPWTPGNLRGPLTAPGFRPLALVVLLAGAALGCYTVLVPAFTSEENRPELAGVLFAVWGLGSAVGGLWAGGRRPLPMSLERRFTLGLSMIAAGMAVPLLAHDVLTMAVALAIGGTVIAPATALQYQLIQQLTPPEHVTETFTWMMTANVAGAAVGAAVVGPVTDSGGSMIGFAIAFAVAVLTAITAWVCAPAWRRAIDRRPSNILSSGSVE
jgi:MFS family permease